jgi:hypothetical protein
LEHFKKLQQTHRGSNLCALKKFRMAKYFMFFPFFLLILCYDPAQKSGENFQMQQSINGNITILDQANHRLVVVSPSNRIIDVINLDLTPNQISIIKAQKESNDRRRKEIYWAPYSVPCEKYLVSFSTRYYRDNCIYRISISPYDNKISSGAFSIQTIELSDSSGFILEKIDVSLERWTKVVDEKATPIAYQFVGKVPMTLDNYMEISNWDCTWHTNKNF